MSHQSWECGMGEILHLHIAQGTGGCLTVQLETYWIFIPQLWGHSSCLIQFPSSLPPSHIPSLYVFLWPEMCYMKWLEQLVMKCCDLKPPEYIGRKWERCENLSTASGQTNLGTHHILWFNVRGWLPVLMKSEIFSILNISMKALLHFIFAASV